MPEATNTGYVHNIATESMKIAQVCPYDFSRPGGVKSHIVSLSQKLTKLGHEVKIIAPDIHRVRVEELNIHYFGKNRSLTIWGTKIDLNLATGADLKALKKFLKDEDFDVIHFHTVWNPFLPFQILMNSRCIKVATFHDTPKSKLIGRTLMPLAAAMIFPFLDQIISVSKSQSGYISRFSRRKIHIIPNGIDLTSTRKSELPERKKTVLFLGRLEPRKGLLHALEAFKTIQKEFPEWSLIIVGDGHEREKGEHYITINNLKKVQFLGFVSEVEKVNLLRSSGLLMAPSLYGESFGIVLLEAMANGLPMTGYANEGYRNVLNDHQASFFSNPEDVQSLSGNLKRLLSNEAIRHQLSADGEIEVRKYDWEEVSKRIEGVYQLAKANGND